MQAGRYCHTVVIFRRLAVFSFMSVTTLAEALKPKYGGKFLEVGAFFFVGGNDFGGSGKTKI